MKVTLNLAVLPSSRERYAWVWTVPLSLAAFLAFLLLLRSAMADFSNYRRVHGSLAQLEMKDATLKKEEDELQKNFEQPAFRKLSSDVRFISGLIDEKRLSLTQLTSRAADLLPPDVRLTGLALSKPGKDPLVRFSVEGKNEEALEKFLRNLESSRDFKDVAILNQGLQPATSAGRAISIDCAARYVAARPL